MPDDLYPVGDDQPEAGPNGEEQGGEQTGKDEGDGGTTALLPESLLEGKKYNVGDELVLKIVHMGDGEVEVTCAPENDDEETTEGERPEMGAAEGDMMAMMKGQ